MRVLRVMLLSHFWLRELLLSHSTIPCPTFLLPQGSCAVNVISIHVRVQVPKQSLALAFLLYHTFHVQSTSKTCWLCFQTSLSPLLLCLCFKIHDVFLSSWNCFTSFYACSQLTANRGNLEMCKSDHISFILKTSNDFSLNLIKSPQQYWLTEILSF